MKIVAAAYIIHEIHTTSLNGQVGVDAIGLLRVDVTDTGVFWHRSEGPNKKSSESSASSKGTICREEVISTLGLLLLYSTLLNLNSDQPIIGRSSLGLWISRRIFICTRFTLLVLRFNGISR